MICSLQKEENVFWIKETKTLFENMFRFCLRKKIEFQSSKKNNIFVYKRNIFLNFDFRIMWFLKQYMQLFGMQM